MNVTSASTALITDHSGRSVAAPRARSVAGSSSTPHVTVHLRRLKIDSAVDLVAQTTYAHNAQAAPQTPVGARVNTYA